MRESTRFSAEAKAELLALVTCTEERTGWTVRRILHHLGLAKSRYRDWIKRAARDALADRSTASVAMDAILPEEKQAVIDYALAHPKDGYRRLAWQMVDADVAFLSPSSVYRVLNNEDLPALSLEAEYAKRAGTAEADATAREMAHGPDVPSDR